jgi:hypothetical protein
VKFVGGTHHGREAPEWVQHLVVAGVKTIDIEAVRPSPGWQPAWAEPQTPTEPVIETYVVRTWRMYGVAPFKFLAIAGKDRAYIESLAWPLFEPTT